jgi:hypothetical protein
VRLWAGHIAAEYRYGDGDSARSTNDKAREHVQDIAWGVIARLIATGTWDLMAYHSSGLHLASGREDASVLRQRVLESQRKQRIKAELLAGLPDTIRQSFDDEYHIKEELRDALERRPMTIVRETGLTEDLVDLWSWPNGDPSRRRTSHTPCGKSRPTKLLTQSIPHSPASSILSQKAPGAGRSPRIRRPG